MPYVNVGRQEAGVRVQWGRGGEVVQVVTCPMIDGMPEADFLASDRATWTSLTRSQINELIVALRQARDGAFGRDE